MTEIIVLLKLVPDIRHIPEDAWDLSRGTLRRNRLELIPNPYDDRALAAALETRRQWGGRITAISMGPQRAMLICARALAFGVDRAMLISDKACAGSDTLATSAVLARAIDRAASGRSSLVFAGMQSPDGDTAQVPVQVAARLGATVVPYVTALHASAGAVDLLSITSVGVSRSRLTRDALPAVITCTDQLPGLPFHISIDGLRRGDPSQVEVVTASDLGLEAHEVGLSGSPTRVVTISVAESVRRESTFVDWTSSGGSAELADEVVARLGAALALDARVETDDAAIGGKEAAESADADPEGGQGTGIAGKGDPHHAVWAVLDAEADGSRLGIIAHARAVARAIECSAVACVVGDGGAADDERGPSPEQLAAAGATDALMIGARGPTDPVSRALTLEQAVREFTPVVMLLPASPEGRVTAPYLAARLGAGLTADCTAFTVKDFTTRSGGERRTYHDTLHQRRPALGGNIEATIVAPRNVEMGVPQMATVRPGPTETLVQPCAITVHRWIAPDCPSGAAQGSAGSGGRFDAEGAGGQGGRAGGVGLRAATVSAPGPGAAGEPGAAAAEPHRVDIERCKVLVSVGRGVGGSQGISRYARPLADALRRCFNVDVEISASRMVVDAGDLARERQVGQTGKTVSPDIYIALGISGSAQHRAGMDRSATIVSVNADADASIRRISDMFVHGGVEDVVPQLVSALKRGAIQNRHPGSVERARPTT